MCARVKTFTPSRHIEYTREILSETADNTHATGRTIIIISSLSRDNFRGTRRTAQERSGFRLFTADIHRLTFLRFTRMSLLSQSTLKFVTDKLKK